MSELVGNGIIMKQESGYYWVKNPQTNKWDQVCHESDPFWSVKCVQLIERYYPSK